jgi:hypothetical protein
MKRLYPLGVILAAAFAFSIAATSVSANPTILPTPTKEAPLEFTAEGGKVIFAGFECEKVKVLPKSAFTSSETAVDVHIEFEGNCKNKTTGNKCKTEGEENGKILILADLTLVDILPGGVLTLGLRLQILNNKLEPTALVITCGVGKIEIKGSAIGQVDGVKTLVKTKTAELLYHEKVGKQEFKTCDELKVVCEGQVFEILGKLTAEEAFKETPLIAEIKVTFAKEAEIHF